MSSPHVSAPNTLAVTEGCGLLDRSERGKLALTGADAKSFLQGQVTNDVEALTPGAGCYAAFLTPKGKMLGDLRILDAGDELLLDTERVSLQELFNMIRRFSVGYDVQLHKRTLQRGLLSLIGPTADARARASTAGRRGALARRAARSQVCRSARSAPTSASTCCATPATPRRSPARCSERGRRPVSEARGRDRARRARPAPLRSRPRRHRDPPGGGT